jgi:DNA-binding NarL/FixJ family response regulator
MRSRNHDGSASHLHEIPPRTLTSKDFSTAKEIGSASTAGVRPTAPPRVPSRRPFSSSELRNFRAAGREALVRTRRQRGAGHQDHRAAQNWGRSLALTPQQREIAEPTALGLTAKQIGEEGLRHRRWSEPTDRAA